MNKWAELLEKCWELGMERGSGLCARDQVVLFVLKLATEQQDKNDLEESLRRLEESKER